MDVPLDIREMTPDDAGEASRLSAELGYPVEVEVMSARVRHLLASGDHGIFVAVRGDRVVGWIHASVAHHLQADVRAEIGGLIVDATSRSAGIGARLVARAEQWARERGLRGIVVRSQIKREAAHRFYLREGYERTKTSAVFSKTL